MRDVAAPAELIEPATATRPSAVPDRPAGPATGMAPVSRAARPVTAGQLVHLQRLAGNRAVATLQRDRAAARTPAPAAAPTAAPAGTGALTAGPAAGQAALGAPPVVQRSPTMLNQRRPSMMMSPETVTLRHPDMMLGGPYATHKAWAPFPATYVPLAGGTFIVDGVPVSYSLAGEAMSNSSAGLVFGPVTLADMQVYVTGSEAARMRRLREERDLAPLIGVLPFLLDRPWDAPAGRFGADGMLRFGAFASAQTSVESRIDAKLGVFGGVLAAGAFAGLKASARADARTTVDTYVDARYDGGAISLASTLDLNAALRLAFDVTATAGVWVELRVPEIPVVTELTHEVQDWPIVGWVVPDLSRWRWRKEYTKEWPIVSKSYDWAMAEHFEIGTGGSAGTLVDPSGFGIEALLNDAIAAQKPGTLTDDPTGPGDERRNGDPAAVSAARAGAQAQIASARRAADREKAANARLLKRARAAQPAGATTGAAPGAPATPSLAVVTGGGPAAGGPVGQLEARGQKLDQATKATDALKQRTDALAEPASLPDGASRNEARSGYDSLAKNADALGDKITNGEEGFAVPAVAEPADADYARMRDAMHKAYDAYRTAFDPARTEKLFADELVSSTGTDPDLASYRQAAQRHQFDANAAWRKVDRMEADLEKAREWYETGDHAMGAVVFGELEAKARAAAAAAAALVATRPVGDWDLAYVELVGGHLMLKPDYRGKGIRSRFYPHDYSAATKTRMLSQIGSFPMIDGVVCWEWRGKPSPRGDHWWHLDDPQEMPTLDHTAPTVLAHWNSRGRTTSYPSRREFYDFTSAPLVIVPKSENSEAGGREKDSFLLQVTRAFRGAKT